MTWISLIGITLAVFALIATLAVRSGFRDGIRRHDPRLERACHRLLMPVRRDELGQVDAHHPRLRRDGERDRAGAGRHPRRAAGQGAGHGHGQRPQCRCRGLRHLRTRTSRRSRASPIRKRREGDIARFGDGIAIGSGVARELGVGVGDRIRLISPDGVKTAFGTSPRVKAYEVGLHLHRRALRHRPHADLHAVRARRSSISTARAWPTSSRSCVEDPEEVDGYAGAAAAAGGRACADLDLAGRARAASCGRSRSRTT